MKKRTANFANPSSADQLLIISAEEILRELKN